MDRRAFIGSALGTLAIGPAPAIAEGDGRPSFAVAPDGRGRWRVRSWDWQGGAWRPVVARLVRKGEGFRLEGRIAAADRAALAAWIEARQA